MSDIAMFDLEKVQKHDSWERNGNVKSLPNSVGYRCMVCNKPVKDDGNTWVHMSTGGELFPSSYDNWEDPDSQGSFPVGPSCKKLIPADYRVEFSD
jgi:hypothetical protein